MINSINQEIRISLHNKKENAEPQDRTLSGPPIIHADQSPVQTLQSAIFRFFICLNSFVLLVIRVAPRA